jgi:hypothetical protein
MAAGKWTAGELRLLGKRPDAELAHRLHRTVQAIQLQRSLRRIPRFIPPDHPGPWTPAEDALLGTAPDDQIARRLDRPKLAVALRRQVLGRKHF